MVLVSVTLNAFLLGFVLLYVVALLRANCNEISDVTKNRYQIPKMSLLADII